MKEEIEDAQVLDETAVKTMVLATEYDKPTFPALLDKESSLAKINEAFEKYDKIVIDGTKDTENYKKVAAGVKELKESKIAWDNAVDQNMIGPLKSWYKEKIAAYDAIYDEFKNKEAALRKKLTAIDDLKKSEKAAADLKKLELMNARIEEIISLGGKKAEENYVFDYDLSLFVKITALKDMTDAAWAKQLAILKKAFEDEKTRVENENNAAAALLLQNQEMANTLLVKQRNLRSKELKMSGFVASILGEGIWEHETAYPGRTITPADIDGLSDEEWDSVILDFSAYDESTATIETAVEPEVTSPAIGDDEDDDVGLPFDDEPVAESEPATISPAAEEPAPAAVTSSSPGYTYSFVFTVQKPYIEFAMNATMCQRIFPVQLKEQATADLTQFQDGIVSNELLFLIYKK